MDDGAALWPGKVSTGERHRDPAVAPVYLDCSDLLAHFAESRFPTGIQRVQTELFKASLILPGPRPIRACAYVRSLNWWAELDPAEFQLLCRMAADTTGVSDQEWQRAVRRFTATLPLQSRLTFPNATMLINIGTSWWIDDYMALIREAKAQSGLFYIPVIHDMVPLIMPNRVGEGMPLAFATWMSGVLMHADVLAAISESTARDMVRFAATIQPEPLAPVVIRLDAEARDGAEPPADGTREAVLEAFGLRRGRFVLFVSTLEARKNHLLVFQGWLRLLNSETRGEMPILVCVGKPGWKFTPAAEFLDRHPDLAPYILMLPSVSDEQLYTLYNGCLFTVYASLYEGWGLPVTESLCHGKVCLCADNSSLPEAGGRFAIYFEGDSIRSFTEKARWLIENDEARLEREQLIAAEYRSRQWPEVLAGLIDGVTTRIEALEGAKRLVPRIAFGTAYPMSKRNGSPVLDRTSVSAEMLRVRGEWHQVESWGLWSRTRRVRLRFLWPDAANWPENCRTSSAVLAYLELRAAVRPVTLTILAGTVRLGRVILPARGSSVVRVTIAARIMAKAIADPGRAFALVLETDALTRLSDVNPADPRSVGFGLSGLTLCPAEDLVSRMAVLDHELLS